MSRDFQKMITTANVNVLVSPKSSSEVLGVIRGGIPVKVFELLDSWAKVDFLGRDAYINIKFLK